MSEQRIAAVFDRHVLASRLNSLRRRPSKALYSRLALALADEVDVLRARLAKTEQAVRAAIRKPQGVITSEWYYDLPSRVERALNEAGASGTTNGPNPPSVGECSRRVETGPAEDDQGDIAPERSVMAEVDSWNRNGQSAGLHVGGARDVLREVRDDITAGAYMAAIERIDLALAAEVDVYSIARCPVHGLHGLRTECFVCGGPVMQVLMVLLADLDSFGAS